MEVEDKLAPLEKRFENGYVQLYTPDGWDDLILELDTVIASYDPDYTLAQVKEKFGTLRFYYDLSDMDNPNAGEIARIVRQYELLSSLTCQFCGADGTIHEIEYWWSTLCEGCYQEELTRKKKKRKLNMTSCLST